MYLFSCVFCPLPACLGSDPEMIRNLTLCNITTSSVSLKWSEPNGESSFYVVEWNDGNALFENKSTSQTVLHVDNLTAGELYYFEVAAVAGDSITKGAAFNSSHATSKCFSQILTLIVLSFSAKSSGVHLNVLLVIYSQKVFHFKDPQFTMYWGHGPPQL